jgi:hypothetical protein
METTQKKYYGGYSYMGWNYIHDNGLFYAVEFDTKQERDEWVKRDYHHRLEISRKTAETRQGIFPSDKFNDVFGYSSYFSA